MGKVERTEMTRAYEARKAQRQADKEAYNKKQDNIKMQEDKAVERGVNKAKAKGRKLKDNAKEALTPNHYDESRSSDKYRSRSLWNHIKDEVRVGLNKTANKAKDLGYGAVKFAYQKVLKPVGNFAGRATKFVTNIGTGAKATAKKIGNAVASKAKGAVDYVTTKCNKVVDWFKTAGRKLGSLGD